MSERMLFGGAEGEEVLGAFDGFLEAAQQLLQIFAAFDEVYVGGIYHEQVRRFVAKEEVFVCAGDFFDVVGRDIRFAVSGFFGDACAKRFRLGLKINDKVGRGNFTREKVVIAFVKLQLFVVEIEVGEDAVFFHEEVGEERCGGICGERFAKALLAFEQKVHLSAKRGARFFVVKIGEEGIVFAVVNAAGVEAFREDAGERGFADAEGAFDGDEARSLGAPPGDGCAFGRGVERHSGLRCPLPPDRAVGRLAWREIIAAKKVPASNFQKEHEVLGGSAKLAYCSKCD